MTNLKSRFQNAFQSVFTEPAAQTRADALEICFITNTKESDLDLLEDWIKGRAGKKCVIFPVDNEVSAHQFDGIDSLSLQSELVTTNSPEEEEAYRLADELKSQIIPNLFNEAIYYGVDLRRNINYLFSISIERIFMLALGIEKTIKKDYDSIFVCFSSFDARYMALLDRIEQYYSPNIVTGIFSFRSGCPEDMRKKYKFVNPTKFIDHHLPVRQEGSKRSDYLNEGAVGMKRGGVLMLLATDSNVYLPYYMCAVEAARVARLNFESACLDERCAGALAATYKNYDMDMPECATVVPVGQAAFLDLDKAAETLKAIFTQVQKRVQTPSKFTLNRKKGADANLEFINSSMSSAFVRNNSLVDLELVNFILKYTLSRSTIANACNYIVKIEYLYAFLKRANPSVVYTYPNGTILDGALEQMCKNLEVKSVGSIYLSITASFRNLLMPTTDYTTVLGSAQTEALVERGYDRSRIVEVGSLLEDWEARQWSKSQAREYLASDAGLRLKDRKIVLIASSGLRRNEELVWMEHLTEHLGQFPDVCVVWKLHQSTNAIPYIEKLSSLPEADQSILLTQTGGIHPYLHAADAVITDVSHAGKQAVYLGRPLWVANISGEPYPYHSYAEDGVAQLISGSEDFKAMLNAVSTGEYVVDVQSLDAFIRSELTRNDGKAAARFTDLLRELAQHPTVSPET